MANTCSTEYRVLGPKKQLDRLWNVLNGLLDANKCDLSDLVKTIDADSSIGCRGYITSIDREPEEGAITIWQDTAWREQQDVRCLLEEKFPGIKIYFYDEEFGCDWCATNDTEGTVFGFNWVVDAFGETDYFETLDQLAGHVNKCCAAKYPELSPAEANEDSIQNLLDMICEIDEDEICSFYHVAREAGF